MIRTLNAAETLGEVLLGLHRDESDQLIVVDSGSTDGTVELARSQGAEIIVIRKDDFTYGRALNRGFSAARHDWILSLSAHTIPADRSFLESYRRAIGRFTESVTVAVGPILGEFDAALSGGITFSKVTTSAGVSDSEPAIRTASTVAAPGNDGPSTRRSAAVKTSNGTSMP